GPRGGYLIGYLVAAYVAGKIVEKAKEKTYLTCFSSMFFGSFTSFSLIKESPIWVWALTKVGTINPSHIGFFGGVPTPLSTIL
ncbi:MAG: biotin transporter BioY, partial [Thermoplasmatales archaeon]|nr:biotin transporter BioY [Thermoplasmatales archaeon]